MKKLMEDLSISPQFLAYVPELRGDPKDETISILDYDPLYLVDFFL